MRFSNFNYASQDATVITASSESVYFPASNLAHPFRSKRWRSTGVTSENVVFDLVTTEAIDSVVLLWPKEDGIRLTDSATIRIQANATNVWTSPSVDQALTINDDYSICSHYFGSDQSYRYWRVVITDPSNTLGFLELGVVWLGKALDITNMQNGFKYTLADQSKASVNEFGHRYVDEYPLCATLEFSYVNMLYSDVQKLEDAYRLNGSSVPVLVVADADADVFDKDHFTVYGTMKTAFSDSHVFYNIFNCDMAVVELS